MDPILEEIRKSKDIPKDYKDEIGEIYQEYKRADDIKKLSKRVDKILEKMYKSPDGFLIPMGLLETEIGKIILKIKFGMIDNVTNLSYGITEAAILADKSRAMISRHFQEGKLKGRKIGGRHYASEADILDYMVNLGRNPYEIHEAEERIKLFNKLKEKGLENEEIIAKMCESSINYYKKTKNREI